MELLKQQVEALIFCSEQSISLDEIKASLKLSFDWDLTNEELLNAIEEIKVKYVTDDFSFELMEISDGYQFLTKKQYHPTINSLIQHKSKKKLSVSQMETLAIIAYRQPIAKSEVEHIRGVSCDYAIHKLLEKELIEISGKSDTPGRPVLYSTSRTFMDYFGIKNVKDLPQLKDIHLESNEIGSSTEMLDASNYIPELPESTSSDQEQAADELIIGDVATPSDEIIAEEVELAEYSVEGSDLDELASADDVMEMPDRKAIYLENENNVEATDEKTDISAENNEE